jgi:signal transduction histidine kinase
MHEQATQGPGARYRAYRWVLDPLAVAAFSVLLAALGFHGIWGPLVVLSPGLSPWWALVFALPACALALIKQRSPLLVLAIVAGLFTADILTIGGLGTFVVLLDVLWTAVFLASPRAKRVLLVLIGVSAAVMFVGVMVVTDGDFPSAFLLAVQFGAIFGTDYWWAVAVSQANELAELHRQRADDARRDAERARDEAVRLERETMARELHDTIAGHVMAMAIRSEAALSTEPDSEDDRAALRAVRDTALDAHAALRTMISVLRTGAGELASPPRIADLEAIVADARSARLAVSLGPVPQGLAAPVEQAVVRIVREALSNCARHAAGAVVDVRVDADDDEVRVRVDSRGGAPVAHAAGSGWGLSMLAERVRALDGDFSAGWAAGAWSVRATIPAGRRS